MWSATLSKLDPANNPDATADILKRELGVTIRAKQDKNIITALAKPTEFIEKRSAEIDDLVEKKVAFHYNEKYNACIKLGLPESMSRDFAVREAKRFYEDELAMLELTYPGGYDAAFGVGNIMQSSNRNLNKVADMFGRRAVRHYKRKKKSSKKGK